MPLGANKAAIMGVAGVSAGADVVLLYDTDHSNVASVSISSDITSTYGEYIFKWYNVNPATDGAFMQFQVNATDGADYDDSQMTTTVFYNKHGEDDATNLAYIAGHDQANGTAFQSLITGIGNAADESSVGELHLFNPSSTTYVKHFYACINMYQGPNPGESNFFVAGYINDTTAIDDINFKMNSGNFDGTIKMWGVKA